jgi:hypothetical protein
MYLMSGSQQVTGTNQVHRIPMEQKGREQNSDKKGGNIYHGKKWIRKIR